MMTRRIALLAFALLCGGCFLRSPAFELPTPGDVPSIDARLERDSAEVDAVVARADLDVAEGRPDVARSLLESADRRMPGDPVLPFLLAIAQEEAGLLSEARRTYDAYGDANIGMPERKYRHGAIG